MMALEKRPIRYKVTLETLSPLHIGSGNDLRLGYEFGVHNDKTWVIDQERLAERFYDTSDVRFTELMRGSSLSKMLTPRDYEQNSPLFRYVLPGKPSAESVGSVVRELIKTPWDKPYIPGSSLKGAIRTALLYAGYRQTVQHFERHMKSEKDSEAAKWLEIAIVSPLMPSDGSPPNYDVFRALHVSDSTDVSQRQMRLINARAVSAKDKAGIPIALESISTGTRFSFSLTVDTALTTNETYLNELTWRKDQQIKWLIDFRSYINDFAEQRVNQEIAYWRYRSNSNMLKYYETLRRISNHVKSTETECILQLGWGGGWLSKTFGNLLSEDADKFYNLVMRYSSMNFKDSYKRGSVFPKSRRVIVDAKNDPVSPFGWVVLKMEREA